MNTLALRNANAFAKAATVLTEALRGITARHVRIALAFGAVYWLVTVLIEWQYAVKFRGWRGSTVDFLDVEVGALWLLLAIRTADTAIVHGARRRTAYVVAVLVACATCQLSSVTIVEWLGAAIVGRTPWAAPTEFATPVTTKIYVFTHQLLFVGTGVFLYAQWRAAYRMQEHLREAEIDRLRKSRLALESRLQALQARVEPAFLFRTLSQVRDLYDRDVVLASLVRASQMLDDLIAYLRAAMPHMRDTSSTVAQEIALARAYLDIARLRMDGRLNVDVAVAATVEFARMPPMMLLPLIDDALAACTGASGPKPSIRIDVRAHGERLQASVTRTPGGPVQTQAPALADIRERLSELFGGGASLELAEPKPGCIEARLDIPLEFAPAAPSEEPHSAVRRARGAEAM